MHEKQPARGTRPSISSNEFPDIQQPHPLRRLVMVMVEASLHESYESMGLLSLYEPWH